MEQKRTSACLLSMPEKASGFRNGDIDHVINGVLRTILAGIPIRHIVRHAECAMTDRSSPFHIAAFDSNRLRMNEAVSRRNPHHQMR
jgi:hypothetical protein